MPLKGGRVIIRRDPVNQHGGNSLPLYCGLYCMKTACLNQNVWMLWLSVALFVLWIHLNKALPATKGLPFACKQCRWLHPQCTYLAGISSQIFVKLTISIMYGCHTRVLGRFTLSDNDIQYHVWRLTCVRVSYCWNDVSNNSLLCKIEEWCGPIILYVWYARVLFV